MVKILSWDTRGLNVLNKQKEVKLICNEVEIGLIGFLKTRIKANNVGLIDGNMFCGWKYFLNHQSNYNGRILII